MASRHLIPLQQPIAVLPEYIAPQNTTLQVSQHRSSWSQGDFTVLEATNETSTQPTKLFSVDGELKSWTQRRHFQDASGQPLFKLSRKKLGVTWFVHSPDVDRDAAPIITIVPKVSNLKDNYDVYFKNAVGDGEDVLLHVRSQDIWKIGTHVYCRGMLVMTVRIKSLTAAYFFHKRPEWEVAVSEGVDLSVASVIAVLLATLMFEYGGVGRSPAAAPGGC